MLDQDGGGVCMFRTLSRGGVRPLDDADVQCGPPSEKLKMLRDAGATEVPHVLPVLGVLRNDAPRTQSELTVFHPWCAGGSLYPPLCATHRMSRRTRGAVDRHPSDGSPTPSLRACCSGRGADCIG